MRTLAVSVAAILVLAVVSPAFAQPFADVPTDHWAFDAIAELAAKGIIEGFPDGTFKGDRGVTRYEVAMIVARILARIEAIKIPAPAAAAPAPQVTRADVQTIQRLVNEFRAELAALGVRVTAVEEELTALKQTTSNVKVTGNARIRYYVYPSGSPSGGFSLADMRNRVQFTGTVAPNVKLVVRARFGTATLQTPQDQSFTSAGSTTLAAFDRSYLEVPWFGLTWRLGQTDYTLDPVGYYGYGLLADPSNAGISFGATPLRTNRKGYIDGALVKGNWAGFSFQVAEWIVDQAAGFNIATARVETDMLAGWTLGVNGLYQSRNSAFAMPATAAGLASGNPVAANGPANTNDTGYGVDLKGDLFPGLTLGAAYATFSPSATASSNAYIGWAAWDLGMMGMPSSTVTAWYKNYGSTTSGLQIPYWTGATTEQDLEQHTAWNFNGWGAALAMPIVSGWSGEFTYESGTQNVGGATVTEYQVALTYALASNTNINFGWWKGTLGGTDYDNYYKIELTTSY